LDPHSFPTRRSSDLQRIIREELGDIIRNLRRSPTAAFNADERIDPEWICYLMGKSYTHPLESHPKWLPHLKPLLSGVFTADNMRSEEHTSELQSLRH